MSPAGDDLLQAIVDTARGAFGARACSVMRHLPASGELEWLAVSGEGRGELEGRRVPATTGLAGWVRASGEPLAVQDVERDPRFARDVASSTGYVPRAVMLAPLLRDDDEDATGVLSVLDWTPRAGEALGELELLGHLAGTAAHAVALRDAAAATVVPGPPVLGRLAAALAAGPPRPAAALALLDAAAELLEAGR